MLKLYIAKQINNIISVKSVYTISYGLANNNKVAWQLAELFILLEKKDRKILANGVYT